MSTDGPPAGEDLAIRAGSASFALASRLFDPATRSKVWRLYAWCRYCDDVTDGQVGGHRQSLVAGRGARVATLRHWSERALSGDASGGSVFAGLAAVVAESGLPGHYVRDHLAAFEMDVTGRRCETLDDTLCYCYHAAGAVGLMMAWIMGIRDRPTLQRGCDLGIAFQLTNIVRDIDDDARHGRIYVPSAWLREANVSIEPGWPLSVEERRKLVPVASRLLDEADRFYASAWYGLMRLPARSVWAVATARHVYADIGAVIRRRGSHAWDRRAATSRVRKLGRVGQALAETAWAATVGRHLEAPGRPSLWSPF
jgi:phytoene synthase